MLDHQPSIKPFGIAPNLCAGEDVDTASHDPVCVFSAEHNISIESLDIRGLSSPLIRKMGASSENDDEKQDDSHNEEEKEQHTPSTVATTTSSSTVADLQAQVVALQKQLMERHPPGEKDMCLHAKKLGFPHPVTKSMNEWNVPPKF